MSTASAENSRIRRRTCRRPPAAAANDADAVLPVFSSGQWAGTLPATYATVGSADFMFLAGGGILAHPDGPAAGVKSLRQAYEAVAAECPLDEAAEGSPELRAALGFFGS
nr:RuBisCO large subunit C-terminal-like domain-containing protein [Chelativorans alearense]